MAFPTETDVAAALEAVRQQRLAASAALDALELYRQFEPQAECATGWSGPSSLAYEADLADGLARISRVRTGLRRAVDDLWAVIAEAGGD